MEHGRSQVYNGADLAHERGRPVNRDAAFPYILADRFLHWWRDMGRPELAAAFQYWADQHELGPRRRESVWRRVAEMRGVSQAA
jgi:hypothetical protein